MGKRRRSKKMAFSIRGWGKNKENPILLTRAEYERGRKRARKLGASKKK